MGWAPQLVVPDNIKPAVIKPSRYEPVLNETYADLLEHYGVQGFPARVRKPRDKALAEHGVLHGKRWVLAPLRNHVFHDLASLNRAIAAQVRKINKRPYADGTGENRYSRFESVDLPHMRPLPDRRWQRTVWRQNTVHPDYHIAIAYHFYSVPHQYVGKEVDVRLRGSVIDVFHRGRQIASHLRSQARGRATTVKEHRPLAHQRAGIEDTRARLEDSARDIGPNVHAFVVAVMERNPNPEFGFRSCYGVLRLANGHEPDRFDAACRYALELGTKTYRGLDNILRTGADLAAAAEKEPEVACQSIIPTSEDRSTTNDRQQWNLPPIGPAHRLAAPARHARRLPRTDGAPRPRRHALRGPPGAADRPRGRRTPLQGPAAAPQESAAAPLRTPASRTST